MEWVNAVLVTLGVILFPVISITVVFAIVVLWLADEWEKR